MLLLSLFIKIATLGVVVYFLVKMSELDRQMNAQYKIMSDLYHKQNLSYMKQIRVIEKESQRSAKQHAKSAHTGCASTNEHSGQSARYNKRHQQSNGDQFNEQSRKTTS